MKIYLRNRQAGFTILEYIVTLVIAATVAAMIYSFFGTSLTQSGVPILRLQQATNLQLVMENITAEYNRLNKINLRYKWKSNTPYSVGDIVLPSNGIDNSTSTFDNTRGRYYRCTIAGTSSNSTLPSWPAVTATTTTLGRTVTDGTIQWTEQGYVWKASQNYPANAIIIPVYNNGHFYKGPSSAFTSGINEPTATAWLPITVPSSPWSVSDGTVTWTEAGTILDSPSMTDTLIYYLTNSPTRYGASYTVVASETKFIQFNGTPPAEVDAGVNGSSYEKNILKVAIQDGNSGRTLTGIFTIR